MQQSWSIYLLAIFMLGLDSKLVGQAFQPEFAEPLTNLTVPIGRDVTFRCLVQNLGGYRVGWVKADTKEIQAIHVHVITYNNRISVSHNGQTVWNLHIRDVHEEDRGQYMCQINTDPMKSQIAYLEVVVPPDFIPEETSGDMMIPEGGIARLSCKARGTPDPRIMWRREDGADIVIRDPNGGKIKGQIFSDEVLTLYKISRSDMGVYLCIASNGVPPSVSKRISLKVLFPPMIQVPNQLMGAPLGTDVTLECYVEVSPKSVNYWVKDFNEMVISSNKYEVENTVISSFETRMALTVRKLSESDVGVYRCVAKNSLGEVDSIIRLYEIPGPETEDPSSFINENENTTPSEEPDNQYVPAEKSDDEDDRDPVTESEKSTNRISNITRNRTSYVPTIASHELSNKVRKIINKFEIGDGEFSPNSSFVSRYSVLVHISTVAVLVCIYIQGLT